MYEAMALAIKMNKGKPEDVKKTLGYAADMALETGNPNDLVSVADLLFLHKAYERVGPLLDLAAEKVPHRSEPLIMSINLARATKDPKRMGDAVDQAARAGLAGGRRPHPARGASAGRVARQDAPRGGAGRRGRSPPGPAPRGRSPRPLRAPDLGRRGRPRPGGGGTPGGDRPLPDPAHGLRGLDPQERLRLAPRGGLRLPSGLRRRLHHPRRDHRHRPREAGHAGDPRGHHPRGDARRAEAGPDDQARPGDDPGRGLIERGATENDLALRRPRPASRHEPREAEG